MENDTFAIRMFKQNIEVDFLKEVTILVPLYWTPTLYAIFFMRIGAQTKHVVIYLFGRNS